MVMRLEGSARFGATAVSNWLLPTQSEPLFRYRVTSNYAPALSTKTTVHGRDPRGVVKAVLGVLAGLNLIAAYFYSSPLAARPANSTPPWPKPAPKSSAAAPRSNSPKPT